MHRRLNKVRFFFPTYEKREIKSLFGSLQYLTNETNQTVQERRVCVLVSPKSSFTLAV